MKTFEVIQEELKEHIEFFGFNEMPTQGSNAWHKMRLGVMSASKADCILAGPKTDKRRKYVLELVAEILTGQSKEISAAALEWGKSNEAGALGSIIFETGLKVVDVPFIYKDSERREGCSPDGIVDGVTLGVETKCPWSTEVFLDFLLYDKIKPEYIKQCQFSMFVTGYPNWIFASYDPRVEGKMLHMKTLERDEKMMEKFEIATKEISDEIDLLLSKVGLKFGHQWSLK